MGSVHLSFTHYLYWVQPSAVWALPAAAPYSPDDGDQKQSNTADIALNEAGSFQNDSLAGLPTYFLFLRFFFS
jgi:hypothetical protein